MKLSLSCQTGIQTVDGYKHPDHLPPDDWFGVQRKLRKQLKVVLSGAHTGLAKSPGIVQQPELVGWWECAEALGYNRDATVVLGNPRGTTRQRLSIGPLATSVTENHRVG